MSEIRVHIAGPAVSMFGSDATGVQRAILHSAVLGRLTTPSPRGPAPSLLAAWDRSADATEWTFHLRRDAQFHDGRALTAADLEFSLLAPLYAPFPPPEAALLQQVLGAKKIMPGATYTSGSIPGIRLIDAYTLHITLCHSDPDFLASIGGDDFAPLPAEHLHAPGAQMQGAARSCGTHLAWRTHPIGAGPFRITRVQRDGPEIKLVRVRARPGYAHSICLTTGPASQGADLALGFASNPDPAHLQRVVLDVPWSMTGIYFNYRSRLAQDVRFRRAVALAIQRAALPLCDVVPTHHIVPHQWKGFLQTAEPYDPCAAKKLFTEVLHAHSVQELFLAVGARQRASHVGWLSQVEQQLRAVGCPVHFISQEQSLDDFGAAAERTPFMIAGFIPSVPNAAQIFAIFRSGATGWVEHLATPDTIYDALVDQAMAESDEALWTVLLEQLSRRFCEQAYAVPIFEEPVVYWMHPQRIGKIEAGEQDTTFNLDLLRDAQSDSESS